MELPIQSAAQGQPVWAFFPDTEEWRLVERRGLANGEDIWCSDTGIVVTPSGPSKYRFVHAPSHRLH